MSRPPPGWRAALAWARRGVAVLAVLGVLAGSAGCGQVRAGRSCCTAGATPPVVSASLAPPGMNATVTVRVGQTLAVAARSVAHAEVVPPGILVPLNPSPGVLHFRAARPGHATVSVARGLPCSPGRVCSHVEVLVGRLQVTVTR